VATGLALAGATVSVAQDGEAVYGAWAGAVVKVEISERSSGAKRALGSAFLVDSSGLMVTNFHVVARAVHDADRYEARWVPEEGKGGPLRVLAIDMVHDLAVVRGEEPPERPVLTLGDGKAAMGRRLWAIGYPLDIGRAIVEGTYNGLMESSLYEKIHFTGSLNPGMSGGPTITEEGIVVGVNVASAGEQVSFLVPADRVGALLDVAREREAPSSEVLISGAREELLEHQRDYFQSLFDGDGESQRLGDFEVPTQPEPFFDCWGDASEPEDDLLVRSVVHECSTEDVLFISETHHSGVVRFRHRWLDGERAGRLRTYRALSESYGGDHGWLHAGENDVTNFECSVDFVEHSSVTWSTTLCVRAYRKVTGLYDAVFKAASLLPEAKGLETSLVMGGVTFDTVRDVSRRYFERIRWSPSS
jgi:hypothetical protein